MCGLDQFHIVLDSGWKFPRTWEFSTETRDVQNRFFLFRFGFGRLLLHDAMHKRGLCRHVVSVCVCLSVCVCVCLSRLWIMSKRINISSKFFHGTHTSLVFPCQMGWWYSDANPFNGDVDCRWGKQKSRFWAYMPAVDVAIGEVLSTWSPVEHGHHLASCDNYQLLRVFDHQTPCAIKSPSPWFYSVRATKCALALYTITIDCVYDSNDWRYTEDNRTESNCMH